MLLVLNSGSSSLKYRLVDPASPAAGRRGLVERVGAPGGPRDHGAALDEVLAQLEPAPGEISGVGHRVVHGGARFTRPTVIDDAVVDAITELIPLAPLHNPGALAGIDAARRRLPGVPQVAVFDTAFHAPLPAAAFTYAIDAQVARAHGIRRYGFHGISYSFVSRRAADLLGRPLSELNMILLHLGNGASAAAVHHGQSVETSMGFTPLEGLVMGSRGGDLDPAVITFLQRNADMSIDALDTLLNRRSGLLGLAGANDMRDVLAARAAGDPAATLAVDVYCHRIRKYVGAYHAVLGRLDAIVFTAGVGEHAAAVRAESLAGLTGWGIEVDSAFNVATPNVPRLIGASSAPVAVCVVPTDEELAIAEDVAALLSGEPAGE